MTDKNKLPEVIDGKKLPVLPVLTIEGAESLLPFVKSVKQEVSDCVQLSLMGEFSEEDLNKLAWNVKRDVLTALSVYVKRYEVLTELKNNFGNEIDANHVRLVVQMLRRKPDPADVEQIIKVRVDGLRACDVAEEHGVLRTSLSRLLRRYDEIEASSKNAIVVIFFS